MIWTLLHRNVVARPPVPSKVYRYQKSVAESGVLNGRSFINVQIIIRRACATLVCSIFAASDNHPIPFCVRSDSYVKTQGPATLNQEPNLIRTYSRWRDGAPPGLIKLYLLNTG